ncbi:MAG: substrate-binding domain-containing protein [Pseudomonadota bacterium]
MKKALLATVAGIFAVSVAAEAMAQDKPIFALVPKNTNNPFFDQARDGCKKAEAELGDFECLYIGPGEHGGGEEQVQVVADLVARGVAGIAVAPSNAPAMVAPLLEAKAAGIPVVTWDSDLLAENSDLRVAYIGTKNYDIGVNLAKLAMEAKPDGGSLCIQSGGAAAANHNERMQGIRDTLAGAASSEPPGNRLTGENGWTEIDGCPLYTDDDFMRANQQLEDILAREGDLDAFLPTGGFPQFVPDAYRAAVTPHKGRIDSGALALIVADTLPVQMDLMAEGLSMGQVGQRPFEMGEQAMHGLRKIVMEGGTVEDPTYTGLDVCTPENADTCIGG